MLQIWGELLSVLAQAIEFLHSFTGNYGLAIVLLTIIIRLILWPLTWSQVASMRKMQAIQPEIQKLQKRYKNDKEKLNTETMKLFRENQVNPAAGCLPMIVQLPFLYAIFDVLRNFDFAGNASFLWVPNLSLSDPIYILPFLAGAMTFLQMKMTTTQNATGAMQGPQQAMLYVMPVMITVVSVNFPAGLALYWAVSTLMGIVQQAVVNRKLPLETSAT